MDLRDQLLEAWHSNLFSSEEDEFVTTLINEVVVLRDEILKVVVTKKNFCCPVPISHSDQRLEKILYPEY